MMQPLVGQVASKARLEHFRNEQPRMPMRGVPLQRTRLSASAQFLETPLRQAPFDGEAGTGEEKSHGFPGP